MNNAMNNPAGTNGFAFVEYASPTPEILAQDFLKMGFVKIAGHNSKQIDLYRQGEINFLLNYEPDDHAMLFAKQHGAGAVSMGFRVADAEFSKDHALKLGAIDAPDNKSLNLSAIQGVGSSIIYFINDAELTQFFEAEFDFIAGIDPKPFGTGLTYIDHLTHNVKRGHMDEWAGFYERIFNFKEIRYFNIKGKMTGLLSRAMTSPCGKIRIPINESSDDKSQIEEFITTFNGEGIQHIALGTDDIYHSVDVMSRNGIDFLNTPDVYFDMLQQRLPWHKENPEKLRELKILIDGDKTPDNGLLLQIFTENMLGPVFFEIIQRKGNEGFGEGNFQALFEAIERDQMQRGKL